MERTIHSMCLDTTKPHPCFLLLFSLYPNDLHLHHTTGEPVISVDLIPTDFRILRFQTCGFGSNLDPPNPKQQNFCSPCAFWTSGRLQASECLFGTKNKNQGNQKWHFLKYFLIRHSEVRWRWGLPYKLRVLYKGIRISWASVSLRNWK